jgi:SacI homology domain
MPGLVRKLVIFATIDGIILQPWHGNEQRNNLNHGAYSPLQIDYGTRKISLLSPTALEQRAKGDSGLEAHGIIGMLPSWQHRVEMIQALPNMGATRQGLGIILLNCKASHTGLLSVASSSYLISITQREQVAQILGKPIYAVTNVAIIPLSSEADASQAIAQARESLLRREKGSGDTPPGESGTDISICGMSRSSSPTDEPNIPLGNEPVGSGIAEDVVSTKGLLSGGFTANWLSRKRRGFDAAFLPGLSASRRVRDGVSGDIMLSPINNGRMDEPEAIFTEADPQRNEQPPTAGSSDKTIDLIPKLLRYTKLNFASRNFFFAYDYDLTRRFGVLDPKKSHLPVHSLADPLVLSLQAYICRSCSRLIWV